MKTFKEYITEEKKTIEYGNGKMILSKRSSGDFEAVLFKKGELKARVIVSGKKKSTVKDYGEIIIDGNFDGYPQQKITPIRKV